MTLGMLLVTNDNHTLNNLHIRLVEYICDNGVKVPDLAVLDYSTFFQKECAFVELLLNSNNNKLNKSSALWFLYRKFFLKSEISSEKKPTGHYIEIALAACRLHPTNYYAWSFLRFVGNYAKLEQLKDLYFSLHEKVTSFCLEHPSDHAAWDAFVDLVILREKVIMSTHWDIERLTGTVLQYSPATIPYVDPEEQLDVFVTWMNKTQVQSVVPFYAIRTLLKYIYLSQDGAFKARKIYERIWEEQALFQRTVLKESGVSVLSISNHSFKTNVSTTNDLILHQKIQHHVNWQRVLTWMCRVIWGREDAYNIPHKNERCHAAQDRENDTFPYQPPAPAELFMV